LPILVWAESAIINDSWKKVSSQIIKKVLIVDPRREAFDLYAETLQGVPKSWLEAWDSRGPKLVEMAKRKGDPYTHALLNEDAIGAEQAAIVLGQNPEIDVTWISRGPSGDASRGMLQKLRIKEVTEEEVKESGAFLWLMQKFDEFRKEHARRSDVTAARTEFNQDVENIRTELRNLFKRQDTLDGRLDKQSILVTRIEGRVTATESRMLEWSQSIQQLIHVQRLLGLTGKIVTLIKDWWFLITPMIGAIAVGLFQLLK
jgi:hypothetical protein